MTSKEFVIWLKGFSKAANEYNITPKQWDAIIEELYKVEDDSDKDAALTNYEPWYNPYHTDYRSTTATALQYPEGTTINYTNSQKKKQQLND
jgi:hypothetical protein